jgi:hypothetical protein
MGKTDRRASFNQEAEQYQAQWRRKNKLAEGDWGWQNGVQREHILPARRWVLGVWAPIRDDLVGYISASRIQANTGKHNLKSSWTQCANLFFPVRSDRELAEVFAQFLSSQTNLRIASIEGIEFEYAAPGNLEPKSLLGELGGMRGSRQTSPDVAVLFGCEDGSSGIYLIENKYTEHSFYDCSGAAKTVSKMHSLLRLPPNRHPERCRQAVDVHMRPEEMCQQEAWGRKYWSLLKDSMNEESLRICGHCPALKGGYQLFRQQALAQGLAESGLFDHVISGVAYDSRNHALKCCLQSIGIDDFTTGWARLFDTPVMFHCFSHQDLVQHARKSSSSFIQKWVKYVTNRYGYA